MPQPKPDSPPSKFARYRASKRAKGKRLLRLWVLDPSAPEFAERMKEEAYRLAASEDEEEVMRWLEAVTADLDLPPYDWPEDQEPGKDSAG
jgi:hypothetical protein